VSERSWTDADVGRLQERLDELVRELPGVVVEESFGHVGYLLACPATAISLRYGHSTERSMPSASSSCRSRARDRARVGPMLPTGMSSAAPTSA